MDKRLFGLTTFERLVGVALKEPRVSNTYHTERALEAEILAREALMEFESAVCQERGEALEADQKTALAEALERRKEAKLMARKAKAGATPAQVSQWRKDAKAMRTLAGALDRHPPVALEQRKAAKARATPPR